MVVESIFWFHPLVWWIGARLIEERERACDEHVVRTLGERQVYTHAIVNICRRYAESPLVCASGVGGSSIRKRIDAILNDEVGELLGPIKKALLCAAIAVGIVIPSAVGPAKGQLNAQGSPQPADIRIDGAVRDAVIDGALESVKRVLCFSGRREGDGVSDSGAPSAEGIRCHHQRTPVRASFD